MREVVLDTETTGLDPALGHRLVEVGCVELINHIPSGRIWHDYFNPQRDVPEDALRVHGLSAGFLSDKPLFAERADDFLAFVGEARLIIHNAAFDLGFLNAELHLAQRPLLPARQVVDTLLLARRRHPGAQNSLDALCQRYGIDNSTRTRHGALLDAELLAEVYLELIGGRQTRLSFAAATRTGSPAQPAERARPRAAPLPARLSPAERDEHAAAVSALGSNAIWTRYLEPGEG